MTAWHADPVTGRLTQAGPPRQPFTAPAWLAQQGALFDAPLRSVQFMACGEPVSQGSHDAFPIWRGKPCPACKRRALSHVQVTESAAGHEQWRALIATQARRAMRDGAVQLPPLDGPLVGAVTFTVSRPASHPKHVRDDPISRPDADKLLRAVGDGLTEAGAIRDDARILGFARVWKGYPLLPAMEARPWFDDDVLSSPGVVVRVWAVNL